MSTVHRVPASAALVLRDRTNADTQHVFVTALYDLIAAGAWTHRTVWRGRWTDELRPAADEPPRVPEPLWTVDATLRRAVADLGAPLRTRPLGEWLARTAAAVPQVAARRTLDALLAGGLLERRGTHLGPTAAGTAALAAHPHLPATAALASQHEDVRAASVKAQGPLAARLLHVIAGTRTGVRGFAYGALGAESPGYEQPNGDNVQAAVTYGWGWR